MFWGNLLLLLGTCFADGFILYVDVQSRFGITEEGIAQAVDVARDHFLQAPDDTVILEFAAGTHVINHTGPAINLRDGVLPGTGGRLVFHGAGINKTTLIFANMEQLVILGLDVYRTTFSDMHITRPMPMVTQGYVVNVTQGLVLLEIPDGFPTPLDIYNPNWTKGRYLRKYTNEAEPKIIEANNRQISWLNTTHLEGNKWYITLNSPTYLPNYSPGDLIGVKSKCCGKGSWGVSNYFFCRGEQVVFEHVKWTRQSRGVLRCGIPNIRFSKCQVRKESPVNGQGWCLATSGGGPQLGQPNDVPTTNALIEDYYAENTGDDSIGFFNVHGATIRNAMIKDSFARGIYLYNSTDIALENNTLERCQVLHKSA